MPSPQPISAPANPSRPNRKNSTTGPNGLRVPSSSSQSGFPPPARTGASPMSFGAAMSGISFNNGGGFSFNNGGGFSFERKSAVPGSYGARFYGDASDSPQIPFSSSITMDLGSFAASSAAFGLMGTSYGRRSYAAAVSGSQTDYGMLSASLASLTTRPLGSMSHSYSRGQLETLMTLRNEAEHTREYECCGIKHDGLHALLEHVEDAHPYTDPNHDAGFSPVTLAMELDLGEDGDNPPSATHSSRSSTSPRPVPNYPLTPTSVTSKADLQAQQQATIAPLALSDVLKSPGVVSDATLPMQHSASAASTDIVTPSTSTGPSPPFAEPKITAASRGAFLGGEKTGPQRFDRAFNEVVAGKAGGASDDAANAQPPGPTAVAPGVLFSAAAALGMPSSSSVVGRRDANVAGTPVDETKDQSDSATNGDRPKALEPHLPQPSLFTTHKAWRCPNPGCNKAYKQSNGLKYHLQKGQCDFAIHDAIDHGLTLEEAEERSRPYVCAVGAGCTKRYRQMNGLKYHYLNSGEHGQYGLRMLQNGTHPHPPSLPPPPKRDRTHPRNGPYNVPGRAPRMGTWPVRPTTTTTVGTAAAGPSTVPGSAVGLSSVQNVGMAPGTPSQPRAVAATATTTAATATGTPSSASKGPTKMPVQRGRDAVLFASASPLDCN